MSKILYYISYLFGFYGGLFLLLKVFVYGTRFYAHISTELFAIGLGLVLLLISAKIRPVTPKDKDGRTVTRKL